MSTSSIYSPNPRVAALSASKEEVSNAKSSLAKLIRSGVIYSTTKLSREPSSGRRTR